MDKSTVTIVMLSAIFVGLAGAAGIDDNCLAAMCQASTGCKAENCTGAGACGFFQITEPYYIDCGSPGLDLEDCSMNMACSEACVKAYMNRYGPYCTGKSAPSCEDYARIHDGGPMGCKLSSTGDYWMKVNAALQNS